MPFPHYLTQFAINRRYSQPNNGAISSSNVTNKSSSLLLFKKNLKNKSSLLPLPQQTLPPSSPSLLLSSPKLEEEHSSQNNNNNGGGHIRLLRGRKVFNIRRTDQQQRNHQPLSLYLPSCGQPTEEKLLKSSRSYESLLLTSQNNIQKGSFESENKMLLQPLPFDNKQQKQQLMSPLETNIDNNEGGHLNGYWSNRQFFFFN